MLKLALTQHAAPNELGSAAGLRSGEPEDVGCAVCDLGSCYTSLTPASLTSPVCFAPAAVRAVRRAHHRWYTMISTSPADACGSVHNGRKSIEPSTGGRGKKKTRKTEGTWQAVGQLRCATKEDRHACASPPTDRQ